jgi:hypothetical protein
VAVNLMHLLALNHRFDWKLPHTAIEELPASLLPGPGAITGLVKNHRNCKKGIGPGTEPKVFWSAI